MEKLTHKSVIAEGNELIAVFMECKKVPTSPEISKYYVPPFYYDRDVETGIGMLKDFGCEYFPEDMLYHSDWNWLMPVVEKIDTMQNYQFTVRMFYHFTEILDNKNRTTIIDREDGSGRLLSTWKAVVEFIKWFNSQTQS
jgi:hypothetical protein